MALKDTKNNNVSAAARLLGVTRDYLRYRLEDKGLASALAGEPAARATEELKHEDGS